jgi:hypothetical protein
MVKLTSLKSVGLMAASLGIVTSIGIGANSLVHAENNSTSSANAQKTAPTIPRYTMQYERVKAEASVLGTDPQSLESSLKNQTMQQLLTSKNLTAQQFEDKVKQQFAINLKALGYSDSDISSLEDHAGKHHDKHHVKMNANDTAPDDHNTPSQQAQ